jgi:hypothetical protein
MITSPEDDSPLGLIADHTNGSYLLTWRGTFDPDGEGAEYYFTNYRNIIYHLDEQVEIMDSIEINMLGGYDWELWDLYLSEDSLLAWGTTWDEEKDSSHLGLIWLDENLNILDYKVLGNYSDSIQLVDFTRDNLGNIIFAGFNNYDNTLLLVKTDPGGEYLMESSTPMWGIPIPNICYLPATDQLMCVRVNWIGYVNNLDLEADTFYLPEFFTQGFMGEGWWVNYDETSAILPGLVLAGPFDKWDFSCVLFDTIAQFRDSVVFHSTFDKNATMEVDLNTTDSIFFGGLENYISLDLWEFDPVDRYYYISMFNFDGDKFWTLHLGGEANYSLMCLTALKNNDCLVAGARYDWRNNTELERDIILYKISSDGIVVSTPEISEPDFKLFPNPARDYMNIQFGDLQNNIHESSMLNIYDVFGRLVYSHHCKDLNDYIIDVSGFSSGIYFLTVKLDTNQIFSRKFIVF